MAQLNNPPPEPAKEVAAPSTDRAMIQTGTRRAKSHTRNSYTTRRDTARAGAGAGAVRTVDADQKVRL